jgi:hypothetical protein
VTDTCAADLEAQLEATRSGERSGGEKDKYKNLARRLKEERNNYKEMAEEKRKEQEELKVSLYSETIRQSQKWTSKVP